MDLFDNSLKILFYCVMMKLLFSRLLPTSTSSNNHFSLVITNLDQAQVAKLDRNGHLAQLEFLWMLVG